MADSRRRRIGSRDSLTLEDQFAQQLHIAELRNYVREHRFALVIERNWAFDFAWPALKLAVEVEGGTARLGRHTSQGGFMEDCHKYNSAALLGWTVLRGDSHMVRHRLLLTYVADFMAKRVPTLRISHATGKRHYVIPLETDPWNHCPSLKKLGPKNPDTGVSSSGPPSESTASSGPPA